MSIYRDVIVAKRLYHNAGKFVGGIMVPKSKSGLMGRLAIGGAIGGAIGIHANNNRMYDNAGIDPNLPMQTDYQMADDAVGLRASSFLANGMSSAAASAAERERAKTLAAQAAAQAAAAKQVRNNKGHASHFSRKYTPPTM